MSKDLGGVKPDPIPLPKPTPVVWVPAKVLPDGRVEQRAHHRARLLLAGKPVLACHYRRGVPADWVARAEGPP